MSELAQPWQPLSLEEAATLLSGAPFIWWVAGGWAIDLFLGRTTRPHGDLDLAVPRNEALSVQAHLAGWRLFAVDPPGALRPWKAGEILTPPIRDLWCSRHPDCWELQIMLEEVTADGWTYRRNPKIRLPLDEVLETEGRGWRYLRPEIELLFKARDRRPKDEADFARVAPALDEDRRHRLRRLLEQDYPSGHPWLSRLA